jgi:hypothetical protein
MCKDAKYVADYECCCGKCGTMSTLTCKNDTWSESHGDSICMLGGPNATCWGGTICPIAKPDANSACEANQTKPEKCDYGQ